MSLVQNIVTSFAMAWRSFLLVAAAGVAIAVYSARNTALPLSLIEPRIAALGNMTAVRRRAIYLCGCHGIDLTSSSLLPPQAVFDSHGVATEVLRIAQVPLPLLRPGDVLIQVRSAALNPVDWCGPCSRSYVCV